MTAALDRRFGPFDGGVWLNCAHQGPLPHPARDAALDAVAAKTAPAAMTDEAFTDVPASLRGTLARLIGANDDDVLLANSTSYTLNVIAQGLPWRAGDEVVCVDGDFPATVVPWRTLENKGVRVKLIGDGDGRIDADTVAAAIGPRTRVACLSWVFSFFGHAVDIASIARACRERDVWCVINASQAIGARPLNVESLDIDALACCGFKWL
jgi:cysteine desulfurase / selenocysteine lyase